MEVSDDCSTVLLRDEEGAFVLGEMIRKDPASGCGEKTPSIAEIANIL